MIKLQSLISEDLIAPPKDKNLLTFWHGGNLDKLTDDGFVAQKGGRYAWGPGLYLTTSWNVVTDYHKGSRKLYMVSVERGVDISEAQLPLELAIAFVNENCVQKVRKEIIARLRRKNTTFGCLPAEFFDNMIINLEALRPAKTAALRRFYVDNGIDYHLIGNAEGYHELMMVLYNVKKIAGITQVERGDIIDQYDLPTNL